MIGHSRRPERLGRRARPQALRTSLEGLEERLLLYSTLGGQWSYGSRITYSFAPDGTDVGGVTSDLYQSMADLGISETAWENAFRRAAATWQAVAGINLVEVPDDGAPLGVSGHQQGDSRFGDIRIFGVPDDPGVLGGSFLPPPDNGGTLAGDILINTDQVWQINGTFDLQTVAIHEIGHSLGLDHSTVTSAVMYGTYLSSKQSLTTDDVNGIRSIYGPRQPDAFDAQGSNYHPAYATDITSYTGSNAQLSIGELDITTVGDSDWYFVRAPQNASGRMTITIQSTDLSSLSPRVDIYNSALYFAGSAYVADPANVYGGTASISFTGVPAGTGVYIRAMGWSGAYSGPNGTGAYGLQVNFSNQAMDPIAPPDTVVLEQSSLGGGSAHQSIDESHEGRRTGTLRDQAEVFTVDPGYDKGRGRSPQPRGPDHGGPGWPPFGRGPELPKLESPGTLLKFPDSRGGPARGNPAFGIPNDLAWFLPLVDAALDQLTSGSHSSSTPARGNGGGNGRPDWLEEWLPSRVSS